MDDSDSSPGADEEPQGPTQEPEPAAAPGLSTQLVRMADGTLAVQLTIQLPMPGELALAMAKNLAELATEARGGIVRAAALGEVSKLHDPRRGK